ncbi:unnamed protein product [Dicrocoelium dendriticum]|nr:unnamed protein product [Dicrocoelium dendriticum]
MSAILLLVTLALFKQTASAVKCYHSCGVVDGRICQHIRSGCGACSYHETWQYNEVTQISRECNGNCEPYDLEFEIGARKGYCCSHDLCNESPKTVAMGK